MCARRRESYTQWQRTRRHLPTIHQHTVLSINELAALNTHISEDYIQCNRNNPSSRQWSIDSCGKLFLVTFTVSRTGVQDYLAWIHAKGELQGVVSSAADIFGLMELAPGNLMLNLGT